MTYQNYKEFNAASRTLQKLEVPLVDSSVCEENYPSVDGKIQMCSVSSIGKFLKICKY